MSGPQFLHAAPDYGYLSLDGPEMTIIESKEDITVDMDYRVILPRNPGIPLFDRKTLLMKLLTKHGNCAPYLDDLCNPAIARRTFRS
ncbi:hypothetical protein CC1G_09095 [Coprinopsis cinerea okayama7|uniref:Uncharacterized protein n=1 Tax=Coprinopsis cinerea (strain Okayama-7 / 130 / ATCC MYA-4618 / FGSC 9003) TaxID=240176 RepID=A8P341_COPC7|nr:hypothetical protein CC1G_09095 [Coprinopsis cinerea okayama7\|eukprot:XP_001838467.2 hypothetical protein CC1G_09095 [Coprinopsis cinerea okayama7\